MTSNVTSDGWTSFLSGVKSNWQILVLLATLLIWGVRIEARLAPDVGFTQHDGVELELRMRDQRSVYFQRLENKIDKLDERMRSISENLAALRAQSESPKYPASFD